MKTLLTLGSGTASEPATPRVFGVISSALEQAGRKLGCWDANRLDRSPRPDVMPDHTITHDNLALAYATS